MTEWSQRQKRKDEVKARAELPDHMYGYCRVMGCRNPARAGTSDGLDMRFCRSHADHHQRHGSVYKGSYTAKHLNPYRQAALAWLLGNAEDPWAKNAIQRVQGLYDGAGPHVEAFRLRGLSPQDRANAAWARLRKHEVEPILVVAVWLAVEMALRDDPEAITKAEYRRVQAAKVVHRMVSGSHKRWERDVPDPNWSGLRSKTVVEEMHVYPRSRGRVLRHIGEALEQAVELLVDHRIEAIHSFKCDRGKQGRYDDRPYPKGWTARPRQSS
ncbi:hypothetical protein [Magnetospirillum moscoviense]|uniref:hypothetical protein n=1 Tax=Magnetospirillum moscoviense TaxID=1437059 RepID=UPI0008385FE6|nr:hypothetical protein [Magnetospirillum moscoviense]